MEFLDRRAFLTLLAMAGVDAVAQPITRASGKRVVVLGAGLSGLAAAWNLMNRGYEVRVFEAQGIPGGRVKTIREPFQNGGYAEAGALRIPNNHRYTMKYIKLMGLESKLAAYQDDGKRLWYLQGKRFTTPESEWPLAGQAPGIDPSLVRMFRREPNIPRSTGSPFVPPFRMALKPGMVLR